MAQSLMALGNSAIYADELVRNYFDPKKIAEIIAYTTGLDKFDNLLRENIRVDRQLEMMSAMETAQQMLEERQMDGLQNAQGMGMPVEQAMANRGIPNVQPTA